MVLMARSKVRAIRPPAGLVVERLTAPGEGELLVFSWSTVATAPLPPNLSAAEADVLALVVRGHSNRQIARSRQTSERTIANQVASLLRKTGAASRFELIRRFAGATGG